MAVGAEDVRRPVVQNTANWYDKNLTNADLDELLAGKHALVVGGTRGIGRKVAVQLARHGCAVTVAGRSDGELTVQAMHDASKRCSNPVAAQSFAFAPVSCFVMKNAQTFARTFAADNAARGVHIIVFTLEAHCEMASTGGTTLEGVDEDFAMGYLARFTILHELLPWLAKLKHRVRICIMASSSSSPRKAPARGVLGPLGHTPGAAARDDHEFSLQEPAHGKSTTRADPVEVANELLVQYLALHHPNLDVFYLNPTAPLVAVRSPVSWLMRGIAKCVACGCEQEAEATYARRLVVTAASPELVGRTGLYFDSFGNTVAAHPLATVRSNVERMNTYSEGLTARLISMWCGNGCVRHA